MKVGFTGTREGWTPQQREVMVSLLLRRIMEEAHEGDCIGSDAEFYDLVSTFLPPQAVHVHPPVDEAHRAFKQQPGNVVHEPKTHFARNRDIVDETDCTIGTPIAMHELPKGGTWYTLNYARKRKKIVIVVWPDGTLSVENGPEWLNALIET